MAVPFISLAFAFDFGTDAAASVTATAVGYSII